MKLLHRIVLPAVLLALLSACSPRSGAALTCDGDDVVKTLRAALAYDQATLSRSVLYETRYLNLWFVDPALDPSATGDAVAGNTSRALRDAIQAAHALRAASPCVPELWDGINIVVVDRLYNDWVSGNLPPQDLPGRSTLSEGDLTRLSESFVASYTRREPVTPAPPPAAGSCTWQEARAALDGRFDPVEEAVVYLVVEEGGANVWAQWAGPDPKTGTDPMLDALVTVAGDLTCLNPPVSTLWVIYTDADQVASLVLSVPGDAIRAADTGRLIESVEVIYPPASQ